MNSSKSDRDQHEVDPFSQLVANSLEDSLDQLSPQIQQQLDEARRVAQQPVGWQWKPALAAGLCCLLVLPLWSLWRSPPASIATDTASVPAQLAEPLAQSKEPLAPLDEPSAQLAMSQAQSYLTVEPEMLADWEMLAVIGEVPDA